MATTKALAILFNSSAAVGLSLLTLFIIWCALIKRESWAFWALLPAGYIGLGLGFVAAAAIGTKTLTPNLI